MNRLILNYLQGIVISCLLIPACSFPAGNNKDESPPQNSTTDTQPKFHPPTQTQTPDGDTYRNSEYQIQLQKPNDWKVVESPVLEGKVINFFPGNATLKNKLPFSIHHDADVSFIVIYPRGLATEFPAGASKVLRQTGLSFEMKIELDENNSKIFYLENGKIWGYALVPENPPSKWGKYALIFAQAAVGEFAVDCYDKKSGNPKPAARCDPMSGDSLVRKGKIDEQSLHTIQQILSGITFPDTLKPSLSELIKVKSPSPHDTIYSPLKIEGRAKGYWFFEGSFEVVLENEAGEALTHSLAQAQGEWMTENWVNFVATLEFEKVKEQKLYLNFIKANASGLKKHDRNYRMPVYNQTMLRP
jgi:hypothetical protein